MSEQPLQVTPNVAEQPTASADADISTEKESLDKAAKSAPYRDLVERNKHLDSLNQRISVIQGKLDAREDDLRERDNELRELLPTHAALKQSHKSMRFSLGLSSLAFGVGGTLVSQFAGDADRQWASFGWGMVIVASVIVITKTIFDA